MNDTEPTSVTGSVRNFYETRGWQANLEGNTEDASLWEDLRPVASEYVSTCRRRVLRHVPSAGSAFLDAASGPIQYPEYLEYSQNFDKRYCVDISSKALEIAKKRLGAHGIYINGDILSLDMPENTFDCTVCMHAIYHIAATEQAAAVHSLLRLTRPGHPVIIVYSTPHSLLSALMSPFRILKRLLGRTDTPIFFQAHPLNWWQQFDETAVVEIYPWRFLAAAESKRFVPTGKMGQVFFRAMLRFEECFPDFAVRWGRYPMIVLKKRTD